MFSLATHTQRPSKIWTLQRIKDRSWGCTIRQREVAKSLIWSPPSKENGQAYVKLLKLIGCKNLQGQVTHSHSPHNRILSGNRLETNVGHLCPDIHLTFACSCCNIPYPFWKPQFRASSFEWGLLRSQYLQLLHYIATVCKVYTKFLARMQHIFIHISIYWNPTL